MINEQNLPLFLISFGIVSVTILILLIIYGIKQKKKKKELLMDPNNVEIKFDCSIIKSQKVNINPPQTCYILHDISDEECQIFGNSLITNKEHLKLDIEHFQLRYNTNFAASMGREKVTIDIEKGKKYYVSYNYMGKCHEIKQREKKN
jgi:hypothetical protein